MSYCRWSEGDVYMYQSKEGIRCCCAEPCPIFLNRTDALAHLEQHRMKCDTVPDRAFELLRWGLNKFGDDALTGVDVGEHYWNAHVRRQAMQ